MNTTLVVDISPRRITLSLKYYNITEQRLRQCCPTFAYRSVAHLTSHRKSCGEAERLLLRPR